MNWKYCPYCGGELEALNANSYKCLNCKKLHYANPKSATGIFVFDDERKLVLAIRKTEPYKGYWDTIGGYVDLGENLETAAVRELEEETGLVAGRDTTELVYLGSSYAEVEFMDYYIPINTNMFCAFLINDIMTPRDDVAGFVRINLDEYDKNKMAWGESTTPLIEAAFEWQKANRR